MKDPFLEGGGRNNFYLKPVETSVLAMDKNPSGFFLLSLGADFILWKHNTPHASNHGGVWKRMIRLPRATLDALILMLTHGQSLNNESFRALLVEVEATINSLTLTVECVNDPESLTISSYPLTMKSNVVLPPPGKFV